MTLPIAGPISVSDINQKVELAPNFSSSLQFLNGYIKPELRPVQPNMSAFYGLNYYQRNLDGNCNNGNCTQNLSTGNIQCQNCALQNVNCANCDTQKWLQSNCNCFTGVYNCNQLNNQRYNCNCNCGKIICTKLYELGYLPKHIFEADQKFGEWLRQNDPYAYYGYIKWASAVVDTMDGKGNNYFFWILNKEKRQQKQKEVIISWARKIATPWAYHMAYKMGVVNEDNRAGKYIMKFGLSVSRFIGKISKSTKPSKSVAAGYAIWLTVGIFWILASLKDKKTGEIKC
jgi:hypothetical protein